MTPILCNQIVRTCLRAGHPVNRVTLRGFHLMVDMTLEPHEPGQRASWETRWAASRFLDDRFPELRLRFTGAYLQENYNQAAA